MILDNFAQRKMDALGLRDEEIFADYDQWKKAYVIAHAGQDITLQAEKTNLAEIFAIIEQKAKVADPTLGPSANAAHKRAQKIMEQMAEKLRKAEERGLATALNRMQDLKRTLFPGGSPQERKNNFMQFYLADPQFIEKLYAHLDPLNYDFIILRKQ